MTNKESQKALKAHDKIRDLLFYHSNNLTKHQRETLEDISDVLRELSNEAYYINKRGGKE